jgi:Ca2+-binding RTX toxin-like protein
MARFRTYSSVDMMDFRTSIGSLKYADEAVIVIGGRGSESYYFGSFSYSASDVSGTITDLERYVDDRLDLYLYGFDVSASRVSVGSNTERTVRLALEGDDTIRGSKFDDILNGFKGDDEIRGEAGDDKVIGSRGDDSLDGGSGDDLLKGMGGDDELSGASGDDELFGGGGRDVLEGRSGADVLVGNGDTDVLTGGNGGDLFVFKNDDGRDTITDYTDGEDAIEVARGADGFGDLRIVDKGGFARITFAETVIKLQGVDASDLDAGDFLF